jgi:hypothetical protein
MLLELLHTFRESSEEAASSSLRLVERGVALSLLARGVQRAPELEALCMFVHLSAIPSAEIPADSRPAAAGLGRLRGILTAPEEKGGIPAHFAHILVRTDSLGLMQRLHSANAAFEPFCVACARAIVEDEVLRKAVTAGLLIDEWRIFEQMSTPVEGPFKKLMSDLCTSGGLTEEIGKTNFDPSMHRLYHWAVGSASVSDEFFEWLSAGLRRLTVADWAAELTTQDRLVWTLVKLGEQGKSIVLPALLDALLDRARGLLQADGPQPSLALRADEVRELLFKGARRGGETKALRSALRIGESGQRRYCGRIFRSV